MKRIIQLFHEISGEREFDVADASQTVRDFVFSVVPELQGQDKEFFAVYAPDGSLISDCKVGECGGPYVVACDIISAAAPSPTVEALHTISAATHHMRVDYSMFEGFQVKGNARTVISRGDVIVARGCFLGQAGRGRYLRREAPGGAWR